MKSSLEPHEFSVDSFVAGLNSAAPQDRLRLNGIGWTARILKQVSALVLIVLITPMTMGNLYAQTESEPPPPPPQQSTMSADQGVAPEDAPQGEALNQDQLGQLVAPIALYPDALVAQVLAASTYPTQVVEADRWVQAQGNLSPDQLGAAANEQNWDPSVKALVAFPSVLAQMDKNIQWTTDLGNAYYNQPDDVMTAVQAMRQRAQTAGTLHDTEQQVVSQDDGDIVIAPANPEVVYVPVYDPWIVYGSPVVVFPGYYYGPPRGVYFGSGLAIGFGVGVAIGVWGHWGWGYHHWGPDWRNRTVVYNHNTYITRSRTVVNRGYNRPGGPPRGYAGTRGAYNRGGYNPGNNRGNYSHGNYNNSGNRNPGNTNRGNSANYHGGNNPGGYHGGAQRQAPQGHPSGGGHPGGGGYQGGGHPSGGGGHPSGGGGGHEGGGGHGR